jgi:hypothetical protein
MDQEREKNVSDRQDGKAKHQSQSVESRRWARIGRYGTRRHLRVI